MTVIVFSSVEQSISVRADIGATPDIEGGLGPVLVSDPASHAVAADGRCAIAHPWPFDGPDADWLRAQVADVPGVEVLESLPADWVWPETP